MATILENESAWSTTAATNANVDTGINWAENQDSASVNNSARGMMSARAKARLDQGGFLAAGGTANALTVTTQQVLSTAHLAYGQRLLVYATATNTSTTVTLAVDGLTAAPIKRANGGALAIGSIVSGMPLDLVYHAGSSEWRCANIAATGASLASFSAAKTVAQTINTSAVVPISFPTEEFDAGSNFAANIWTPPAGTIYLGARATVSNGSGGTAQFFAYLYKDSVVLATAYSPPAIGNGALVSISLSAMAQVDGTNAMSFRVSASAFPYDVQGGSKLTTFHGALLA